VASVGIDTSPFFSDVIIKTSGRSAPVICHRHRKATSIDGQRQVARG